MEFVHLALAALAWFLLHAAVAGSGLRRVLVNRFGDKAYRGGFSLASVASLWWLVSEYRGAPFHPLWVTPSALRFVPLVLVPVAFVFLVGAFTVPNPTSVGGEKHLDDAEPARGLLRVTRHPFLWSVVLWASAHLLVNADVGSLLFFGSLGLTALRGAYDIDRKRRLSHPQQFERFERVTSNVPFAAVVAGRGRLVLREVWLPLVLGMALALGAVALHPHFFGASVVPGFHG
ncbi:MAG TPA: NnrU family protein [Polyangiaceae bacterium]|nr:NnrU family protein [Polyangiaceae bacterium]